MGKRGRLISELENSDHPDDRMVYNASRYLFWFAGMLSNSLNKPLLPPRMLFDFPWDPEQTEQTEGLNFLWRVSVRYLGPWLKQGASEIICDLSVETGGDMRAKLILAQLAPGGKNEIKKARDVFINLGIWALEDRGVSVYNNDPSGSPSAAELADKYACHRAHRFLEAAGDEISPSGINQVYRQHNRLELFADLFGELHSKPNDAEWKELKEYSEFFFEP